MENKTSKLEDDEENYYHAPLWQLFIILFSILFAAFDTVTDILLAINFILNGHIFYAILTITFIFLPIIFIGFCYSAWCCHNYNDESFKPSCGFCCSYLLFFILGLVPIHRYLFTFNYWCKCRKAEKMKNVSQQEEYYTIMNQSDTDAAFLIFFERFLHSTPQLCLQLTIILIDFNVSADKDIMKHISLFQLLSISASIASVLWCIFKYEFQQLSYTWRCYLFLPIIWKFFITVGRVILISLTASITLLYTGLLGLIHMVIMMIWLMAILKIDARSIHLAFVYIFVYIPIKTATLWKLYLFYYIVHILENAAMILIILLFTTFNISFDFDINNYIVYLMIISTALLFIGIFLKLNYYICCHPTTRKICKT